jgi:hypothetical protein
MAPLLTQKSNYPMSAKPDGRNKLRLISPPSRPGLFSAFGASEPEVDTADTIRKKEGSEHAPSVPRSSRGFRRGALPSRVFQLLLYQLRSVGPIS